jgi:hypothetical protein
MTDTQSFGLWPVNQCHGQFGGARGLPGHCCRPSLLLAADQPYVAVQQHVLPASWHGQRTLRLLRCDKGAITLWGAAMKYIITLLLFIASMQYAYADNYPDYSESVVRIYSDRDGYDGLGAGFFISADGKILTAYHVVQGAKNIYIHGSNGEYKDARLLAYDDVWDIAMLQVSPDSLTQNFIPIGNIPDSLLKVKGIAIGYPANKIYFVSEVSFNTDTPVRAQHFFGPEGIQLFAEPKIDIIPINMTFNKGMSGGPVIVNGKVIGILTAGQSPRGVTFCWAIPISRIKFLNPLASPVTNFSTLPSLALFSDRISSPLLKINEYAEKSDKLLLYKIKKRKLNELLAKLDPKKEEQVQLECDKAINVLKDAKSRINEEDNQLLYKKSVDILYKFSELMDLRLQFAFPFLKFGMDLSTLANNIKEDRRLLTEEDIRKAGHDPDRIYNVFEFDRPVDSTEATFNIILGLEKEYSDNYYKLSSLTALIVNLNKSDPEKFKIMLGEFIDFVMTQIELGRSLDFDCLYYFHGFEKNSNIILRAYEIVLDTKKLSALSNH